MSTFQRARQPAQKEQRRQAILSAAAALFAEGGYDALSLTAIADRVGLAKSNLYRYFESREEILLELLAEDLESLTQEIEAALAPLAGTGERAAAARVLARAWAVRPRSCQLVSVLAAVLERNVTEQRVAEFKLCVLALNRRIANALHAALPGLSIEQCGWVVKAWGVLVAGLWPFSNPSPIVARVQQRPELAETQYDFAAELERSLDTLLAGLASDR